jgi:hypothetical protein
MVKLALVIFAIIAVELFVPFGRPFVSASFGSDTFKSLTL